MEIQVNGKRAEVPEKIQLSDYLAGCRLQDKQIVVLHNDAILQKERWQEVILCPQDRLEIVTFVGGG